MKHKLAIALASLVVVVGIGSTVAWAATHGSFSGHMGQGHMQQTGNGHMMGQMDRQAMRALMAKMHPGFDAKTLDELTKQCTQAMKNMSSMHRSVGDMDDMHGINGSSGAGGMMGGSGSGSDSGDGGMMSGAGMMGATG